MGEAAKRLAEMMAQSGRTVFFGGAGVSTESGIPDFRSAHGLYRGAQGRSYEEMLSIGYFTRHAGAFWDFYRNVMLYPNAKPNAAHLALSRLEKAGRLSCVLTQNIDGLHQRAGSQNVLELHGTVHSNTCLSCGKRYGLDEVLAQPAVPRCPACGRLIKPDVVLYGEPLDEDVLARAIHAVETCELLIVGGTSLVVHPAAGLIGYRRPGVPLTLINRDATPYDGMARLTVHENISQVLSGAADILLQNT